MHALNIYFKKTHTHIMNENTCHKPDLISLIASVTADKA